MVVFDDLWNGAHRRHCSNFRPAVDQTWQATCFDFPAETTHVPEVLRYYLPEDDVIAFSMYRSIKRNEADEQILTALRNAKKSIDTIQVNFTLELICDLNVLYNLCSIQNSLPYVDALLSAAEDNGAHVRILIKPDPIEGIENTVALDVLVQSVEARGLSDRVEIRLFDGDVHYKTNLIDEQFLIIGSQNFHYSAFGQGTGLAEYNLGTDSPNAIDDFKRLFEYHWEKAALIEP
jgi:cardiolipin synthase